MKNLLFGIFLFCFSFIVAQQVEGHVFFPKNVDAPISKHEKALLKEVFAKNISFVTDKPNLLKNIKDLLRNRVQVMYIPYEKAKGSKQFTQAPDLSTIALYNAYNPALVHDTTYNEKTFNILKYQINFYPNEKEMYKLGNYYITILPQKRTEK